MSIIVLSEKIFKDKGLYWNQYLVDLWKTKPLLNPVYDILDHGVECDCCSKIVTESYTHPTAAESKRERRRGRPRLGRDGVSP